MVRLLQIVTLVLTAGALTFALAHAAELPGKRRLDRETYLAVQAIYYPGFTIGGITEPGAILAAGLLLILTPQADPAFGWTAGALVALVVAHATYWLATHPVNGFWLKDRPLGRAGGRFFAVGGKADTAHATDWTTLRDRWEYSHVARASLILLAFVLLAVAVSA